MKAIHLVFLILISCTITKQIIPIEEGLPIQIYFCPENNCSAILLSNIKNASTVKCAFYHLNIPELIQTLQEKNATIITDDQYIDELTNIDATADASKALMHNKFCILDNQTVITGSYNPTPSKKADDLIIIQSKYLARNYLEEFQEMQHGKFHGGKKVKDPTIIYNNATIHNSFCPEDNCAEKVLKTLQKAQNNIKFILYQLTDTKIIEVLEKTKAKIQGILDTNQKQNKLLKKILNKSKIQKNIHHKLFIIDNTTIITGSYNPTKNGNTKNDENLIIIEDKIIAEKYLKRFNKLIDH